MTRSSVNSWTQLPQPQAAARVECVDAPNSLTSPYRIAPGGQFNGAVDYGGDLDAVRISLTKGMNYTFSLTGRGSAGLSDPVMALLSPSGEILAVNDDADGGLNARFTFTPRDSGTYHLVAGGASTAETGSYALCVSAGEAMPSGGRWSPGKIAEYLTDGYWRDTGFVRHSYEPGRTISCDLTDLSTAEARVARMAFSAWSEATGVRFDTRSTAGKAADLRLTNDDRSGAYSEVTAGYGSIVTNGYINIPVNWAGGPSSGWDSYYYQTWLHEIGHALGLGHSGNYNNSAVFGTDNLYLNDSWQATVMSYFSQTDNTAIKASYAYVVTPMIADLLAIQSLYGTTGRVHSGDTSWGVGATTGKAYRLANQMMVEGKDVTLTIVDQGGIDWLLLNTDREAQLIDLKPGNSSNVYGLIGNLVIATGTVIENAIAGYGNDRIIGNNAANHLAGRAGDDRIYAGRGDDTLDGGAGADRLVGGLGDDLYIVDAKDTVIEAANGGIDRIRASIDYRLPENVEVLLLKAGARYGTGNELDNAITGTAGGNFLSGRAGNDRLYGLAGNDTLDGGAGADRLVGGAGDDTYRCDSLDTVVEAKGGGYDTIIINTSIVMPANVERVVLTGSATAKVTGNELDNRIIGNDAANRLIGGDGMDLLTGGGGADVFVFRAGQSARITDFEDDLDQLRITGAPTDLTVDGLLATARETATSVYLSLAGGTIRLDGITVDDLRDDILMTG